ncbi:GGDEF domain-containing protein [Vibrio cholerae]|uniref:diguanylate cyclase n=2 Tax=Vibrionaceae TaxID=641 RepID=A0A7Z7VQ71_VIBCL|nr:diguanylate cyclase [Vibrio cholerae]EGQ8660832.1 diguanylate cyclase [Vibrio cholerae]EGR0012089.1 GGDEF domain-containing protein [Vibrio cholerae]EGR0260548.1 GGDEF domain-containing protein [Vibrio cholerae]EGR0587980.1 GGDEF domain-containing protein [Vibrio cholerae]
MVYGLRFTHYTRLLEQRMRFCFPLMEQKIEVSSTSRMLIMTRKKFSWILVTLIIFGFFVTSLVSYKVAHDTLEEQINKDSLPLTSDNIYSEIQQDLIRPIFISSLMAQDTFVREWTLAGEQDPERIIRYLREIQRQYQTISSFYISDRTGHYYHYTGILKQVSESNPNDAWFYRVKNSAPDKNFEVNIDIDTANSQQTVVFVNYKVFDFENRFLGVIGVGLSSDAVSALVEKYQKRYNRHIYFINELGEVTLHGSHHPGFDQIQQREGLKTLVTQILTSPSVSASYYADGQKVYLNSRWVDEFQWYIIVEQKDEFNHDIWFKATLGNLAISAFVALGVLGLAQMSFRGYQKRLEDMAVRDKLTGAYNRQVFEELVDDAISLANKESHPLSLAVIDLDHFKQVNDNYGHPAGDLVLQRVVALCQRHIAQVGTLCRWGGEEFVVLLPHMTQQEAYQRMESIRAEIAMHASQPQVTVSIGVVQYQQNESLLHLFNRADQAMYTAKSEGRNKVVGL